MMNYDLHPQMILRVPRFPVNKEAAGLKESLHDPVFRDALYLASDSMFDELKRNDFRLSRCSEKMKHSLAKYLKRMCYRPTPFGSFAGVAIHSSSESGETGIVIQAESFEARLIEKKQKAAISEEQYYYVNPSIYPYGSDFRLLGKSEKEGQNTFAISEIYGSDLIIDLLSGKRIMAIEEILSLVRAHEIEKPKDFVSDMMQLQIILPYESLQKNLPRPLVAEHKNQAGSFYDSFCGFTARGSLPENTTKNIHQALSCLDKISSTYEPGALKEFKKRFEKLFDRQEIPLLHSLDPELGIDYDGLSHNTSSSTPGVQIPSSIPWSRLHEILLRKWITEAGAGSPVLEILDEDLAGISSKEKNYPPGLAMMFSVCGDKLHLKSAGGVSSLNMIGRFTVLDPDILDLARELAVEEMEHNPDVVFAELSHIDSPEFASVQKKTTVYNYQIPFFEPPRWPEEFLIGLNDLTIALADNKLRLWSRRLNKQIIPRFSSAYNYHKSTLPVFRFLCDLQHEGVHANLNFSMESLFPGMQTYPRVTYKDIILEGASWHLDVAKELLHLKKLEPENQFSAFDAVAARLNLPIEFSYEVHDHLLHINRTSGQDIRLLLKTIPSSGTIIFREYFKSQESLVRDGKGNGYTHECIAFLTNREQSYNAAAEGQQTHDQLQPECREKLFPFDDWLYFKIYLHPAGFKELLISYIQPFITRNLSNGNISSWFFISYYDDDFHLRLRLKQIPGREGHLLKSYRKLEQDLRMLPNIKKLELSTYFKERERYASIGIQRAEELFRLSSEIVLSELCQPDRISESENEKFFSGVRHLLMVCQAIGFGLKEVEEISDGFSSQIKKSEKIELDMEFREQRKSFTDFLISGQKISVLEKEYLEGFRKSTLTLSNSEKLQIVADMNHMHLNRLFLRDQGFLERKSYWFLGKFWRGTGRQPGWPTPTFNPFRVATIFRS